MAIWGDVGAAPNFRHIRPANTDSGKSTKITGLRLTVHRISPDTAACVCSAELTQWRVTVSERESDGAGWGGVVVVGGGGGDIPGAPS